MNEWKILHFFPQNILNVEGGGLILEISALYGLESGMELKNE